MDLKPGMQFRDTTALKGHVLVIKTVGTKLVEYYDVLGEEFDLRIHSRIGWESSIESGDLVLIKPPKGDKSRQRRTKP